MVKIYLSALLLVFMFSDTIAREPAQPDLFQAGIYGDFDRNVTCISGQPGAVFEQVAWAWVPGELGLAYITLRFEFPDNVDFTIRPVFNDLVLDCIVTEFVGGTVEWNMIVDECPSGWIPVFFQQCTLLDDQQSTIRIHGEHSMMRDCNFILNDLSVSNNLSLNDPDCMNVSTEISTWGRIKSIYKGQ